MTSEFVIGWELMFHSVQNDIKTKEDVLIVLIHWALIKSRFRCIGLGDDSTFTVDEPGSELLPSGWNTKHSYAIKYTLDNQLFIFRGLLVENEFILNLVRVADKNVSNLVLSHNDVVKATQGSLEVIVPTHLELFYSVKSELITPLIKTNSKEAMTQTVNVRPPSTHQPNLLGRSPSADIESQRSIMGECNQERKTPSSLCHGRYCPDAGGIHHPLHSNRGNAQLQAAQSLSIYPSRSSERRYADPFGVGRSDLYPFAPPGQGNIFDPFNREPLGVIGPPGQGIPGGLPRGAVPPGARFDPFGPPDPLPRPLRPRFPPDSDHLPPPGFDDMFM